MRSKSLRTVGAILLTLLLAGSFIELGFWQIHRAQEVERLQAPPIEQPTVPLTSIATTTADLPGTSVNRIVEMKGRYLKFFQAPNQSVSLQGKSQKASLVVGLFCLDRPLSSADPKSQCILVARGVSDPAIDSLKVINPSTSLDLTVVGRLYPRQVADRAMGSASTLSRLDPALVTGTPDTSLFDGYVVAQSEVSSTGELSGVIRIDAPAVKPQVPGYFWQHISYVVIWWLLAALVLVAPLYRKRELGRGSE